VSDALVINEIYLSLQGESTHAGLACVFVRLTGCHLRCSYCDTAYAFRAGKRWTLEAILAEVRRLSAPFAPGSGLPLVEVTGGEPLLQHNVTALMRRLCDDGFTVLLETSGALDISGVDPRVHRIMDLKCPSSGECDGNRWENLACLGPRDEVKFVIATVEDYLWSKQVVLERRLAGVCPLLFSWAGPLQPAQQDPSLRPLPPNQIRMSCRQIAERVLADSLPVRFQVQLHKHIWSPCEQGV